MHFIEYDNLKDRRKKTIDKNCDTIISKYENAEPLNERMRTGSKYIRSIEIKGEDTAKTELIYNIKNVKYDHGGIRLFLNLHNSIYNKLYKDVKSIVEKKVSFKNQTVCQYSVIIEAKNKEERIRDNVLRSLFGDDEDIGADHNFVSSKSVSSSIDSLDDTLQAQKHEVKEKIET